MNIDLPKRTLNFIWGDIELILDMETTKLEHITSHSTNCNKKHPMYCLTDYFSIRHKLIEKLPRKVVYSEYLKDKINNKKIPPEIIKYLKNIEFKFENGDNVNGYLNKGSVKVSSEHPSQSYIQDPHNLLYGIKHLHISNEKEHNNYFYKRSDYLLFIYHNNRIEMGKKKGKVFFIDVRNHSDIKGSKWVNPEIAEIFDKNFPKITNEFWLSEVVDLNPKHNDENVMRLTNAGLSVSPKVNEKVFLFDSVTGSGYSLNATRFADFIIRTIRKYLEYFNNRVKIENLHLKLKNNMLILHDTESDTGHVICNWSEIDFLLKD